MNAARGRLETTRSASEAGDAVMAWTSQLKLGIAALTLAERQELLRLMLHQVSINRDGRIKLVLAVPVDSLIADESRVS